MNEIRSRRKKTDSGNKRCDVVAIKNARMGENWRKSAIYLHIKLNAEGFGMANDGFEKFWGKNQ